LAAFDDGRDGSDTLGTYVLRCARPVSGSHLAASVSRREHSLVEDRDVRLLFEVLFDIRRDVEEVLSLLRDEDEDGEEDDT
jgi:hypothetical protein